MSVNKSLYQLLSFLLLFIRFSHGLPQPSDVPLAATLTSSNVVPTAIEEPTLLRRRVQSYASAYQCDGPLIPAPEINFAQFDCLDALRLLNAPWREDPGPQTLRSRASLQEGEQIPDHRLLPRGSIYGRCRITLALRANATVSEVQVVPTELFGVIRDGARSCLGERSQPRAFKPYGQTATGAAPLVAMIEVAKETVDGVDANWEHSIIQLLEALDLERNTGWDQEASDQFVRLGDDLFRLDRYTGLDRPPVRNAAPGMTLRDMRAEFARLWGIPPEPIPAVMPKHPTVTAIALPTPVQGLDPMFWGML